MIPKMKPMTDPRPIAGAESRRSFQRGTRSASFGAIALIVSGLLQVDQDLGKAEQADRQRRERQAAGELGAAEGEARRRR